MVPILGEGRVKVEQTKVRQWYNKQQVTIVAHELWAPVRVTSTKNWQSGCTIRDIERVLATDDW